MDRSDRANVAHLCWVLLTVTSTYVAGCGSGEEVLPREPVSGTVEIGGQPLKDGRIDFRPGQGVATAAVAPIVDGVYSIDRSSGLVPAKYQVMISSNPPASAAVPAGGGMPGDTAPPRSPKEPIPAKYNTKSKLSAEVKKGDPNTFNFDLDEK